MFKHPENDLWFSKDEIPNLENLFKHENLAICRSPSNITNQDNGALLCKDFVEITLVVKNGKTFSTYMRTLLGVPCKSVPALYESVRNSKLPNQVAKASFLMDKCDYLHNFDKDPVFELPLSLRVDLSNINSNEHQHAFVRFLDANEKKDKSNPTKVIIDNNYENNAFSWVGKVKFKLQKMDEFNSSPELDKLRLRKETNWDPWVNLMRNVPNIKAYAILDPNTGDIWVSSPGFAFTNYEDKENKKEIKKFDEKECLLNVFRTQGNVKSNVGVRLLGLKFNIPKDTYDMSLNFVTFAQEKVVAATVSSIPASPINSALPSQNPFEMLCGVAGRTNSCIFFGIYSKDYNKPLEEVDPANQLTKIYNKLYDIDKYLKEKVFHESHIVKVKALFSAPGSYQINHVALYNSQNQLIPNLNESEEVRVVIRHDEAEVDLLG